jgi:hypothetical protein
MSRLSKLGVVLISAVLVSGIAFTQGGRPTDQASAAAAVVAVPNVVGEWGGQGSEVCFEDVLDPNGQATFSSFSAPTAIVITDQNGRAFAGYQGNGDKLTGAVLEDGTITMQSYGGNNRNFYSGKLLTQRIRRAMAVTMNGYEQVGLASIPSMCTASGVLTAKLARSCAQHRWRRVMRHRPPTNSMLSSSRSVRCSELAGAPSGGEFAN